MALDIAQRLKVVKYCRSQYINSSADESGADECTSAPVSCGTIALMAITGLRERHIHVRAIAFRILYGKYGRGVGSAAVPQPGAAGRDRQAPGAGDGNPADDQRPPCDRAQPLPRV